MRREVGMAERVEQVQAREVRLLAQPRGRAREQDHAGGPHGQRRDGRVAGTRCTGPSVEVVHLVHHQQVPAGRDRLRAATARPREQRQAAEHELLVEEGMAGALGLDRGAALLIEEGEAQLETAQQFQEPLVDEVLRRDDQHPFDPPREQQPGED